MTKPYCSRSAPTPPVKCEVTIPTNDTNMVELRIFLGISSSGHFDQILEGLAKFLTKDYFDNQDGKVLSLCILWN